MELKLNVYKKGKKEIEKTYEAETYDLSFGIVEDLIDVIDIDKIDNNMEIAKMVLKAIPLLKPFLKDVFDGLTDDEIRRTKISELVNVFVKIFTFTFSELTSISTEKN